MNKGSFYGLIKPSFYPHRCRFYLEWSILIYVSIFYRINCLFLGIAYLLQFFPVSILAYTSKNIIFSDTAHSLCTRKMSVVMIPFLHTGHNKGSLPVSAFTTSYAFKPSRTGSHIVLPIRAIAFSLLVWICFVANIPTYLIL